MRQKKILFLTLKIFSVMGGIERLSRVIAKALNEKYSSVDVFSMYDKDADVDTRYLPAGLFRGFAGNRIGFATASLRKAFPKDVIVLSHINLLVFGYLAKLLHPKCSLVLVAHGIEVWSTLKSRQKKWLEKADKIICVSDFTRDKMIQLHGIPGEKCVVINNCLDPFLDNHVDEKRKQSIRQRHHLENGNKVLLTLSRLSAHDRDKGYEKVLTTVRNLQREFPGIRYIIAGKYDDAEKAWLDQLVTEFGIESNVIITGPVANEDLAAYFQLSDVYIMPSTKEGFGIIFIEAMYFGVPVIAGNADGSVDALGGGEFGQLVDPRNQEEIDNAVRNVLNDPARFAPPSSITQRFGFATYREQLAAIIDDLSLKN